MHMPGRAVRLSAPPPVPAQAVADHGSGAFCNCMGICLGIDAQPRAISVLSSPLRQARAY